MLFLYDKNNKEITFNAIIEKKPCHISGVFYCAKSVI